MMGPEIVTIAAGGAVWSAFVDAEVRAAYNEAARSFRLTVAAEGGPFVTAWAFKAGTPVDILFNGDLVCRGYVDRYQPRLSEHAEARIVVSGRGKGQDLIDSSADHPTGQFKNKTPVEIMRELDRAGVGVVTNRHLERIENYRLTPGETVFRCGEKLCRKQQMTITGEPDGRMLVTNGLQGMHAGGLIEGVNIKAIEADHNWSGRHSKVIVRGQRAIGHGRDAIEIEAVSQDGAIGRNRPLILLQDDDTTKKIAKKRADHRRDREAGSALKASVTVQGFRDDAGKIWHPGYGVFVESPFADIAQVMLIESVTFTQSREAGSLTALGLVDPRAYKGKGGKGGKSGGAWQTDAGKD
jgi:prophage tail gpP-like protein